MNRSIERHFTPAKLAIAVAAVLLLVIPLLMVYFSRPPVVRLGSPEPIRPERRVTFLTVNDVYRLDGVAEGRSGGLARLRTLREWIERDAPNTILLHAGDFLSPSLISKKYYGEQMIDVMNHLDGNGPAPDHRMFVTFGNHEFDDSTCTKEAAPLSRRVDESKFIWLASNLDFSNCPSMKTLVGHKNVRTDGILVELDGVKLGIFGIGLTPDEKDRRRYPSFEDPAAAAERSIEYLRDRGAELIVALTHLSRDEDQALIRKYASKGLDLLVGGHDHSNMVLEDDAGRARGFKADSDARTAWRVDVYLARGARPRIAAQLITLNEAIPPDVNLAKRADWWFKAAGKLLCADRRKKKGGPENPNCLMETIGRTQTKIELEETANRSQETGIGDWLADRLMEKTDADVAIINSGNLGLNEDLEPGTVLLLKHIVDLFRFDDVAAVRKFPAQLVCKALSHGFAQQGSGAWPHVAGVEVDIEASPNGNKVAAIRFTRANVDCDSSTEIKVASVPFLLCGGDGYPLKAHQGDDCVKSVQSNPFDDAPGHVRPGEWLSEIVEAAIRAAPDGIRPEKKGRIRMPR